MTRRAPPSPATPPLPDPQVLRRTLTSAPVDVRADDLPHLRAAALGGAVRARLEATHTLRAALRTEALNLAARHAGTRDDVRALLVVWAQAGIPVMPFKGFALSEFVYGTTTERFYGDVDLLLPGDEATVTRAAHLAIAHGWRSDGQHANPDLWTHETMHLYSPQGRTRLDVHRWVIADVFLSRDRTRHLTAGLWSRARPFDWHGIPILRPDPLDEAVLTLGLSRLWGGDLGGLKPADYLDFQAMLWRAGPDQVTFREQLLGRASELRGTHSWSAFTALCDPARQHVELDLNTTRPVIRRAIRQDGVRGRQGLTRRVRRAQQLLPAAPAALLDVLAAMRAVQRGGDPRDHLARWTPHRPPVRADLATLERVVNAVRLTTRLLHPVQSREGVCVPRAYATYRALRRLGHPAVFVSGVSRGQGGITGHAWVEDDRGIMPAYGEDFNRLHFRTLLRSPES